jgi:hypothetical protein
MNVKEATFVALWSVDLLVGTTFRAALAQDGRRVQCFKSKLKPRCNWWAVRQCVFVSSPTRCLLLFGSCSVLVGCLLWREDWSIICQPTVTSQLSVSAWWYVYTIYTEPLSVQALYSRLWPMKSSSCYNGSLVTWMVVRMTAGKFKPLGL